jgi:phospholipase/carboxylesterase
MRLAPYLDPRFYIVSARAPNTLAPGSYAWFHVQFTPQGPVINPEEAERSRLGLLGFIDELVETYGVDPARVYVMGFSQGAIMGLSLGLTRLDTLAGLVAHSGRILPEIRPIMAPPDALRGLPVLVAHGTADAVLPIHHGRASRELLSTLPVDLTYREYPIGHEISAESLGDTAAWLSERLG